MIRCACDRGGDEREQVVEHVLEAPLDVEGLPVGARELPRGQEVDPDPDEGDHEDRPSVRRRRRDETANGPVDDQAGEDEQRRTVRLRGQDLRAAQPEGGGSRAQAAPRDAAPRATSRARRRP